MTTHEKTFEKSQVEQPSANRPAVPRNPTPASIQSLAEAIADVLFVNGAGERAERLVLTIDGPPKRDLGGWSRLPAVGQIKRVLATSAPPVQDRDPLPAWQAELRTWAIYCFQHYGHDAYLYNGLAALAGMEPWENALPAPPERPTPG